MKWSILSFPSISLVVLGVGDLDDGVVAHDNQKAIVFLETDIIGVCKDTKTKSNHFELDSFGEKITKVPQLLDY